MSSNLEVPLFCVKMFQANCVTYFKGKKKTQPWRQESLPQRTRWVVMIVSSGGWLQLRGIGSRPIRLVSLQKWLPAVLWPSFTGDWDEIESKHLGSGRLLLPCAHAHEDPWPPGWPGMLSCTQQECRLLVVLILHRAQHNQCVSVIDYSAIYSSFF